MTASLDSVSGCWHLRRAIKQPIALQNHVIVISLTYIDEFDVVVGHCLQGQVDVLQVMVLVQGLLDNPPDPLTLDNLHEGREADAVTEVCTDILYLKGIKIK